MEEPEVFASVIRSPLHRGTWVPFLADTDVMDSVWAGPLGQVKKAAQQRVEAALGPALTVRWMREGDDWILVVVER